MVFVKCARSRVNQYTDLNRIESEVWDSSHTWVNPDENAIKTLNKEIKQYLPDARITYMERNGLYYSQSGHTILSFKVKSGSEYTYEDRTVTGYDYHLTKWISDHIQDFRRGNQSNEILVQKVPGCDTESINKAFPVNHAENESDTEPLTGELELGKTVFFGSYEQDGNQGNGAEEIEWKVVNVQKEKALLVSQYCLDCHQYHSAPENVSWQDSDLCKWLNQDFLNTAFNDLQKALIVPDEDEDNKSLVWILAESQYPKSLDYKTKIPETTATSYLKSKGIYYHDRSGYCKIWLRNQTQDGKALTHSSWSGNSESEVTSDTISVQPALWVTIK